MTPLISIITINYNNASGLEKTIRSIVSQSYSAFEYLVIDADSTDGSKEVIRKYADNITFSVSEPDTGIYNGMNKGILNATGKYILFINSGDELLHSQSLESIYRNLQEEDIISFDLMLREPTGETRIKTYPDELSFRYFMFDSLPHPASFIKKELFTRIGLYNEHLKICSDWGFFLTAICKHNVLYKHVSGAFSIFTLDGMSSAASNNTLIANEKRQILQHEFPMYANLYDDLWEARLLREEKAAGSVLKKMMRRLGF